MRLNPELLRKARYDVDARNRPAKVANEGEQLLLAILAASENLIQRRKSFRESAADYNPLGQFGAAHRGVFGAWQRDDF